MHSNVQTTIPRVILQHRSRELWSSLLSRIWNQIKGTFQSNSRSCHYFSSGLPRRDTSDMSVFVRQSNNFSYHQHWEASQPFTKLNQWSKKSCTGNQVDKGFGSNDANSVKITLFTVVPESWTRLATTRYHSWWTAREQTKLAHPRSSNL